ncbi:MAG: response regulator transcription factor [Pseudomonadota bacterium]
MIEVFIVEDDLTTLASLQDSVAEDPRLNLSGSASTYREALAALATRDFDVLLTDLGLPDGHGLELIHRVKANRPDALIMVLTTFGDELNVVQAIRGGARGYLLKDDPAAQLTEAIVQLTQGASPLSASIARYLLTKLFQQQDEKTDHRESLRLLSAREREILELVAQGYRPKEVSGRLGISYHTVVHHIRSVYEKLEVHSRSEAVYKASQLGEI